VSWSETLGGKQPKPANDAPRPKTVASSTDSRARKWAMAALDAECSELAATPEGERNQRLNTAAFALGQIVAGGSLSDSEAWDALREAAQRCGLEHSETEATIASGMGAGQREPRTAPESERTTSTTRSAPFGDPRAAVESEPYATRWRIDLASIIKNLDLYPTRLNTSAGLGEKFRLWRFLKRPDGNAFESFEEFCETAQPHGLGTPMATIVAARKQEPENAPENWNSPNPTTSTHTDGASRHSDNLLADGPTAADPLRGLRHLGIVAVMGRQRLLDLAAKPIAYVWQDIAVAGTIVLISGPPAEGKTTLLFLVIAARLNTGEAVQLLGRRIEPAPPGKWIVLIEGEHSEASTSRKLLKSIRLLGIDESALDRVIVVARKAVRLGSPEWLDVEHMVSLGLVSDIAIDTIARCAPADANDEREQVAIFDAIATTIEKAPEGENPLVWTVAHNRKNGSGGLADVSGSAQRTGQADTVLMIAGEKVGGQTVSTTVTFPKLREDPDEYPLPVTFAITGGTIVTQGVTLNDDRPLETRILEQLELGPRTANALGEALGRSGVDIQKAISNLFEARSIVSAMFKVRGQDRKGFQIRRD
jgi:hypothetical protein